MKTYYYMRGAKGLGKNGWTRDQSQWKVYDEKQVDAVLDCIATPPTPEYFGGGADFREIGGLGTLPR